MALPGSLPTPYPFAPDTRQLTANGSAQRLVSDSTAKIWASFIVQNRSTTKSVFLGESAVAASTSYIELSPGQSLAFDASDASLWYAITDGASVPVVILGAKQ